MFMRLLTGLRLKTPGDISPASEQAQPPTPKVVFPCLARLYTVVNNSIEEKLCTGRTVRLFAVAFAPSLFDIQIGQARSPCPLISVDSGVSRVDFPGFEECDQIGELLQSQPL